MAHGDEETKYYILIQGYSNLEQWFFDKTRYGILWNDDTYIKVYDKVSHDNVFIIRRDCVKLINFYVSEEEKEKNEKNNFCNANTYDPVNYNHYRSKGYKKGKNRYQKGKNRFGNGNRVQSSLQHSEMEQEDDIRTESDSESNSSSGSVQSDS